MKNLSSLLKLAAIGFGAFLFLGAVLDGDNLPGLRIIFAATGVSLVAAAFVPLVRRLLFIFASFLLICVLVYSIPSNNGGALVFLLIAIAGLLAFGVYNGYKTFVTVRNSRFAAMLQRKLRKTDALIEPALSISDVPLEADEDGNVLIRTDADWQKFYAQYTPIRTYYTKVAGVTFKNKDGTDRQAILSRCNNWDEVSLEPFTYRGDPAYAVWTRHGQIGNLSADDTAMISTVYADFITLAEIKEITGGTRGHYYGCNLTLTVYAKNAQSSPMPPPPMPNEPMPAVDCSELSDRELFPLAVDVVLETGQASISILHRRLQCGYARAARLLDEMEERGLVSPFNGSEPRIVMITRAGWEYMRSKDPGTSPEASPSTPLPAREVSDAFIAEAQWYAARGGADLIDDE